MNLTKLPRPEMEPVSSGSRFSVTPQPVNGGTVTSPESGPPNCTVYPFSGSFWPLPIRTSVIGDAARQPGPTLSGIQLTRTLVTRSDIFVVVVTSTGKGSLLSPDFDKIAIVLSSVR